MGVAQSVLIKTRHYSTFDQELFAANSRQATSSDLIKVF